MDHGITHDVVLEIDPGIGRVGVGFGEPALELARYVTRQPNLNLVGVMVYEGHVCHDPDTETKREFKTRIHEVLDELADTVELLKSEGIDVPDVKVGSTPTSLYSAKHPLVTEIDPGMYPFLDVGTCRRTPTSRSTTAPSPSSPRSSQRSSTIA